uniref:Tol protein n=1 Tax=Colletotrichum fructicola (strain Nara gc5) TaxID=1213859 RepID=L2G2J6_COLFN
MRAWLEECEDFHEDCELESGRECEFNGPLRLLDLQHGSVVLRENAGNVRYACLSHCWGTVTDNAIIKTTRETLDQFKIKVPEHCLPANLLDAIRVCRSLGIDYLWIDSLCIIQHSDEDWNTQAAQMSDIYENAHVTIAATRSANALGGCYLRRHPKYLAEPVPAYEGVFVLLHPSGLTGDYKRSAVHSNQPLLERGWVYQEMRLSRRVLHFCDEEVIWVCQESRLSESECDGLAFSSLDHPERSWYTEMPHGLPSENPKVLWNRWVDEYSRLKLTYPHKDRMAALAGLAKRMQNHHDMGRYLSGLWENSLNVDLGWWTDHPPGDDSKKDPSNGSAEIPAYPSWSWASVNAPIEWDCDIHRHVPIVEIQHIDFVADGPVHMGVVSKSSGSITVKARALDSSDVHPPATKYDNAPTQIKGIDIWHYRPDRSVQGGQTKMGGLILVISVRPVGSGIAVAIHVKLRNDHKTYERVGAVFLDYTSYGKKVEESNDDEDAIEPWESLPMMEVTIV